MTTCAFVEWPEGLEPPGLLWEALRRQVVAARRDGDLRTAHEIWQAKFSKALQRYLSLIADSESDGASRDSVGVKASRP